MSTPNILAFSGSTRRGSFNTKLLHHVAGRTREAGANITVIDLADYELPLYNGDFEEAHGLPDAAVKLKELFKSHDGLLLACPEYNGSITPLLKNTIDWVSRPMDGEKPLEPFTGRICSLVSASPGALGGLRGLVHVRAILSGIGVIVLPLQVAVGSASKALDSTGAPTSDVHQKMIGKLVEELVTVSGKLAQ